MTVEKHVEVLRELRDTGDVSDWRALESALDAARIALTRSPEAVVIHESIRCDNCGDVMHLQIAAPAIQAQLLTHDEISSAVVEAAPADAEGLATKWRESAQRLDGAARTETAVTTAIMRARAETYRSCADALTAALTKETK